MKKEAVWGMAFPRMVMKAVGSLKMALIWLMNEPATMLYKNTAMTCSNKQA